MGAESNDSASASVRSAPQWSVAAVQEYWTFWTSLKAQTLDQRGDCNQFTLGWKQCLIPETED